MNKTIQSHTATPWQVKATFPDKAMKHEFTPHVWLSAYSEEFKADVRIADIPDVLERDDEQMANANMIVRAVNCHAALIEALQMCMNWSHLLPTHTQEAAREALKQAEGVQS